MIILEMRQDRTFKKMGDQVDYLAQFVATLYNRFSLWRAKRLADQYCLLERCRVFVLPIAGHYVVTPSTEVKRANREVNKGQRKNIYQLLKESVYTVTYDNAKRKVNKEHEDFIINPKKLKQ